MRYAIIVSRFNSDITQGLLKGALKVFKQAGVKSPQIMVEYVPGAWEIPFMAQCLAKTKKYQAIVTLGAVIKGDTTHDFWINHAVFPALQEIAEEFAIPVTLGIITCNNWKQALARSRDNEDNRGYFAAKAALEMSAVFRKYK